LEMRLVQILLCVLGLPADFFVLGFTWGILDVERVRVCGWDRIYGVGLEMKTKQKRRVEMYCSCVESKQLPAPSRFAKRTPKTPR
jgi:hypothetical protein